MRITIVQRRMTKTEMIACCDVSRGDRDSEQPHLLARLTTWILVPDLFRVDLVVFSH